MPPETILGRVTVPQVSAHHALPRNYDAGFRPLVPYLHVKGRAPSTSGSSSCGQTCFPRVGAAQKDSPPLIPLASDVTYLIIGAPSSRHQGGHFAEAQHREGSGGRFATHRGLSENLTLSEGACDFLDGGCRRMQIWDVVQG